jgi:hypothetical protein
MLKQISCDKFIEKGIIRKPIELHEGLNTVIGHKDGANSIGKSTFLLIIDFIFAGNDYVNKASDVLHNVGNHMIKYQFEFNGVPHYFSRSTANHTVFNICNENYKTIQPISKDEYCQLLLDFHDMALPDLNLRETISPFIRVWGRATLDENKPLLAAKNVPDKKGIAMLLKLFNRYSEVKQQANFYNEAKDRKDAFMQGQKYDYIVTVENRTVYRDNEKRICELNTELQNLTQDSSEGLLDLDSFQAQQLADLRLKLSNAKRHRTQLIAQKKSFEAERAPSKQSFQKDFESLQTFFPNVDLKKLTEIEQFHTQLSSILKKEFKESTENLQYMIDFFSKHIEELEQRILDIHDVPNVSQAVLEQYALLQKELVHLQESNKNFDNLMQLKKTSYDLKQTLNHLIREIYAKIQEDIQLKIQAINNFIFDGQKTAPILTIQSSSKYSFFTPNDRGTGSEYKGLVVFDLALLHLTSLPLIVHDSVLLKQIQDSALEKILELYNTSPKQVIIALDKEDSYTEKTQQLLRKSEILRLYPDGGELFGWSWNTEKIINKDKQQRQ